MRDSDEPAAVAVEEALEELQPGEVEIVRRLVEQEDVGIRVHDRLELGARGLAARAGARLRRLREVRDLEAAGLAADRSGVRELEAAEHAEQRRLADAVRPDNADPAARRDDEGDAVEDDRVAI